MRSALLLSFRFMILFAVLSIKSDDFYVCINQLTNVRSIATEKLALDQKKPSKEQITDFTLKTKSEIKIPVTFYDRGSNVLMIAASALPAPKESMEIFTKMFPSYDIVLFDYCWANQYGTYLAKSILTGKMVKKVLLDPIEELETVVNYFAEREKYTTVVGLGECYSCFHLAKLQSNSIKNKGTGPFTHLILDSCWYSLRHFAERICYDPLLPISPQDGGAPKVIKCVTDNHIFKSIVLGSIFAIMKDISIRPNLSIVEVPVLFIHGKNDLFVPMEHFYKIWDSTDQEKRAALLTPYRHADNLGDKKLYQYVVEQFVASKTTHDLEKSL